MTTKQFLKISEMAKLADTTRRTLIFYDESGLFCPREKNAAGYRYYEYGQLYDLLFILGLRKLGFSVTQIRALQAADSQTLSEQLGNVQTQINQKIVELNRIQTVVTRKLTEETQVELPLYQAAVLPRSQTLFWCSRRAADCTEEQVAELFSSFYQELDSLALMDTGQSGFLAELPAANPADYADAAFRVIKEATLPSSQAVIQVVKPAGQYIVVRVVNTTPGICQGLAAIQQLADQQNLQLAPDLWQLNLGDTALTEHGGTELGQLEYYIQPSVNPGDAK